MADETNDTQEQEEVVIQKIGVHTGLRKTGDAVFEVWEVGVQGIQKIREAVDRTGHVWFYVYKYGRVVTKVNGMLVAYVDYEPSSRRKG